MASLKRDKAYYDRRLHREHPIEWALVEQGKLTSAEALLLTGLKKPPSRLNNLIREWKHADQPTRQSFALHIGSDLTGLDMSDDAKLSALISALRKQDFMVVLNHAMLSPELHEMVAQAMRTRNKTIAALKDKKVAAAAALNPGDDAGHR